MRVGVFSVDSAGGVVSLFPDCHGFNCELPLVPGCHAMIRGLSVWVGTSPPSRFNEVAFSQAFVYTPLNC